MENDLIVWTMLIVVIGSVVLNIVQAVINGRSIPADTVDKWIGRIGSLVEQTETTMDNDIAEFLPYLKRIGMALGIISDSSIATPVPTPAPTPAPAPPSLIEQEIGTRLNMNHLLLEGVRHEQWGDGRMKDVPAGYTLRWWSFFSDDTFAPSPEILIGDAHGGMKIEVSHRRGTLEIDQHLTNGVVQANRRYLLVVKGIANLKLKPDSDGNVGHYKFNGRLIDGDSHIALLPERAQMTLDGNFDAQWPIETSDIYQSLAYQINLHIGNQDVVPFDAGSSITITSIEFQRVADNYGDDVVIRVQAAAPELVEKNDG